MHGSVLEEKSSFKMLELTFSFNQDQGSNIISTAKTASKKNRVLICFLWSFLLLRLLCITTNLPHNHAWIIVVTSGLGLLIVEFPLFPYLEPPYFWGRSIHYSDRLHGVSVIIPKFNKDVYVNSFFPHTARLWNSLTIQWFSLTYDLNGFKSRIKTSFNCKFFLNRFPVFFNYFVLLFLVTPCLIVAVQPCMEWIPIYIYTLIHCKLCFWPGPGK